MVLATPVAQRVGVARDVGTARRAAAQLLAATTPALDDETRRSVLELTGVGEDAFLASFADDETVRSLSSPPSSLIDATVERSAGWAAIQRNAATRLRKEVDRLVDRSSGAARDAWALLALLTIGSTGVTLMLVARTVRSIDATRDKAATAANAANAADTISSAARTEITAASALVAPPALDESGVLACLIEFARAHHAALDEQLDVFDRLDVDDGGPRQIALAQDLERSILRIRRLSEAVLVMVGAEATRPSFDPQPLATVLDAAIGEVGGTGAISWSGADGFQVSGEAMIDVAHLVAELLDLSRIVKIDSDVVIKIRTADADRVLMVLEHALGNENPVDVASIDAALHGTWVAGGIGWMAAGELARRRGIDVALDESSGAGVLRVAVMVPGGVISDPTRQHEAGMIPTNKEECMVWGWTSAGEYLPATGWRPDGDFVAAPARLSDAVPTGDAFETGLSTLLESGTRADSRSGAGNS